MKLRHKKTMLFFILSIMGIGLVILSLTPGNPAQSGKKASGNADIPVSSDALTPVASLIPSPYPSLKPTPTDIPTPTPFPVYSFEDECSPEIKTLMQDYYDAKINCDIDKLKTIFSDPLDVPTLKQLQEDIPYDEEYKALKCYVKKSYEKGAYIVYVYYEVKFLNIDTPAPAVTRFYLVTDAAGKLKIFSGTLDEETKKYYDERMADADVQKLITETNEKVEVAKTKDELLKTFLEELDRRNNPSPTATASKD